MKLLTVILLTATPLAPQPPEALYSPLYVGASALLGTASLLTGIGWAVLQLTPWGPSIGGELLTTSEMFGITALHSLTESVKQSPLYSLFFTHIPSPHAAWKHNQELLGQIPATSTEDVQLLRFLERRWLSKNTGCYPFFVHWLCPTFGISFQLHPLSTNSYARDPANKSSETYRKRVEEWKKLLPHPRDFPLILTRPANIQSRLPHCMDIHSEAEIASPAIVDLTDVDWKTYLPRFSKNSICIQRVQENGIGGIRLLSPDRAHENYLLDWISRCGLSANRIELDRYESRSPSKGTLTLEAPSIETLHTLEKAWNCTHPQKTLLFRGTLHILKDLYAQWKQNAFTPTRAALLQLYRGKIELALQTLIEKADGLSFHDTTTHLDAIHSDITPLLEVLSPYTLADFPAVFRRHLTSIPAALQPLASYGLHSSGMTTLAAICNAVKTAEGRTPRLLFGENTYFECILAAEKITQAKAIADATEEDWKEMDILLAQFNPVLKRIHFKADEYRSMEYEQEKIVKHLRRALEAKKGKPLTLALDTTIDFSNSPKTAELLAEFQEEIKSGKLNIICYRSGIKFDIFGMDNYCGAPFFMLSSNAPHLNILLTDPALQTDTLSANWFCLAFQSAAPYLDAYRKQIFDNTRAILNAIPQSSYRSSNSSYRVVPVQEDADPAFIDIKVFGPLHALRGELLGGAYLTIKCMQAGLPMLYRPGLGFYHPNLSVLHGPECTTIRLTVGLDPNQIDVIARAIAKLNSCNF